MAPPLYQKIVDSITERLGNGEFKPGDRMYSVDECCRNFNVSATTAVRALEELKKQRLIYAIKGKGSFFNGIPAVKDPTPRELKTIGIVSDALNIFSSEFQLPICRGIEDAAHRAGMGIRLHHIPALDMTRQLPSPLDVEEDEGLVLIGPSVSAKLAPMLDKRHNVCIDTVISNMTCVATDHLDGMAKLISLLQEQGHRHLLLASWSVARNNVANNNERVHAFEFLVQERGLKGDVALADAPADLLARCQRQNGPTAVMFTQDDPAVAFINHATAQGVSIPDELTVTGFDGVTLEYEEPIPLTTLAVDRQRLGETAVEALCAVASGSETRCLWKRVQGQIRMGNTVGSVG